MSTNKAKLEVLLKLINSAAREAIVEYEKAGDDVPFIDSKGPHPLDDADDHGTLKSAIRTLEGACAQLCATLAPPSHTANNLSAHVYDLACLRVAVRENITGVLANHPNGLHVDELSGIVGIDPKKLARVLRLLATRGFYSEVDTDTFANNRLSLVLHRDSPISHLVSLEVDTCVKGTNVLYEALKDPERAFSEDPEHSAFMYACNKEDIAGTYFDWMKSKDAERERFYQAMRGISMVSGTLAVVTQFPFDKYSTVVDIGGGTGAFTLPLARTHKHIKVTLQDLPATLVQARSVWASNFPEAVEGNRVEFVDLDFFAQGPVKGKDIYYLRSVLHNWSDEKAIIILQNVREALGPHSRVLIHDHVIRGVSRKQAEAEAVSFGAVTAPEPMLPNFGVGNIRLYQKDLVMLTLLNARERTLQNLLHISTTAGLKCEKVWDIGDTSVLELSAA